MSIPFNQAAATSANRPLTNTVPQRGTRSVRGGVANVRARGGRGGGMPGRPRFTTPQPIESFPIEDSSLMKKDYFESHDIFTRCVRCCAYDEECDHDVGRPGGCFNCRKVGAERQVKVANHTTADCVYVGKCYQVHNPEAITIYQALAAHFGYECVFKNLELEIPPFPGSPGRS